jgi:predicted ATPase/class 3 adenylate cyclase
MLCPHCQAENREGRRFCAACGAALARVCPACGFSNEPEAKFCGGCGVPLAQAAGPGAARVSPQAYTPPHLAERIQNMRGALEGERKQVTVLFADLKGSMELLADRDPEDARKILDPVLERMMDAVHRYEGTVNQVMGDGVMALFGAPVAHEDHAVRAGYAALTMQQMLAAHVARSQEPVSVALQIRIGLNSGEVVVRGIRNDLTMEYSAVGQTTHLAARMEQLAEPQTILATEAFARLTEGYLHFKPLGLVTVRGLSEPIEVFQLVDAEITRTRFQAAARGLTRFVGRSTELQALREAIARAGTGHGQVVALVGDSGVGKSRLVYEFVDSDAARGWLTLETGSVSYGRLEAYRPVRDILKAYFQVDDRDDAEHVRNKVIAKVRSLDEALLGLAPALLAVLDVPPDDMEWHALDPAPRRQRILDAVKHLLLRQSQLQPVLILFENLHWIDADTQAVLDTLVDSLPTSRILLLVNYRPEYRHAWGSKSYYRQLRVDPLPPESADIFLRSLLGDGPDLDPLKRLLIERTEGNPLFLEESVRTLVETRVLIGDRGARRLTGTPATIRVPATVHALLAARIDRLPPDEKRLLQSAAVIGEDVPFPLLLAIADLPEPEVRRGLAHLQTAEFLYETSLFPQLAYTFKHALTHDVAYESLLQHRRRSLHARIVDAIERLPPGILANEVEQLAHHAFRGEVWQKAVGYLRQAGTKAAARSAYRDAVACFEQALLALTHLAEDPETLQLAFDLRMELRPWLVPFGDYDRIFENLREAEALAEARGDRRGLGIVYAYMADAFRITGQNAQAVACGERALALAHDLQDFSLQVLANMLLGHACHAVADYPRAIQLLKQNVNALSGDLIRERFGSAALPSVFSRAFMVFSLVDLGEFAEAVAMGTEAVRIAAEEGDTAHSQILAAHSLGLAHLCQGDLDRAIPLLQQTFQRSQASRIPLGSRLLASALGYAYALSGRVADAIPLLEQALQQAEALKVVFRYALWLAWLGEAYLFAGRGEDARQAAERAIERARVNSERGHLAHALRLRGEVSAHAIDPARADPASVAADVDQAAGWFREALAIAVPLGMRPLHGQCRLGLGRLFQRAGRLKEAREELETATSLFGRLGMRYWESRGQALRSQI